MAVETISQIQSPEILDHDLNQYFPELLKFESIEETEKSAVYQKIKPTVEQILNAVVQENFALSEPSAVADGQMRDEGGRMKDELEKDNCSLFILHPSALIPLSPPATADGSDTVSALAWNIERGNRFAGIVEALKNHAELKDKNLLLLTELDYGMARSGNRFVARELAKELKLNYVFAPVYIALQKGSGIEADAKGENTKSLHGLAMFSKHPMKNLHAVALPNGKDKMFGKEKRLGYLRALVADIEHKSGNFRAVTVHLDAHSSRRHRHLQMKIVLDHLETLPELPTIIGGDWNTTTYNAQTANRAILGYFRRVLMGVKNVVKNHYPHPDRYFEKGLFREIEKHGFDYKNLNETGAGTLHYDMGNAAYNTNLGDWVPRWCFPFIFWAARRVGGRVSARLDWFAGKGIEAVGKPKTIGNLKNAENVPLSDHDAISLDFTLIKS